MEQPKLNHNAQPSGHVPAQPVKKSGVIEGKYTKIAQILDEVIDAQPHIDQISSDLGKSTQIDCMCHVIKPNSLN